MKSVIIADLLSVVEVLEYSYSSVVSSVLLLIILLKNFIQFLLWMQVDFDPCLFPIGIFFLLMEQNYKFSRTGFIWQIFLFITIKCCDVCEILFVNFSIPTSILHMSHTLLPGSPLATGGRQWGGGVVPPGWLSLEGASLRPGEGAPGGDAH